MQGGLAAGQGDPFAAHFHQFVSHAQAFLARQFVGTRPTSQRAAVFAAQIAPKGQLPAAGARKKSDAPKNLQHGCYPFFFGTSGRGTNPPGADGDTDGRIKYGGAGRGMGTSGPASGSGGGGGGNGGGGSGGSGGGGSGGSGGAGAGTM
jgi:hypothetical protein